MKTTSGALAYLLLLIGAVVGIIKLIQGGIQQFLLVAAISVPLICLFGALSAIERKQQDINKSLLDIYKQISKTENNTQSKAKNPTTMRVKKCPHCGTINHGDVKECNYCNRAL